MGLCYVLLIQIGSEKVLKTNYHQWLIDRDSTSSNIGASSHRERSDAHPEQFRIRMQAMKEHEPDVEHATNDVPSSWERAIHLSTYRDTLLNEDQG